MFRKRRNLRTAEPPLPYFNLSRENRGVLPTDPFCKLSLRKGASEAMICSVSHAIYIVGAYVISLIGLAGALWWIYILWKRSR